MRGIGGLGREERRGSAMKPTKSSSGPVTLRPVAARQRGESTEGIEIERREIDTAG